MLHPLSPLQKRVQRSSSTIYETKREKDTMTHRQKPVTTIFEEMQDSSLKLLGSNPRLKQIWEKDRASSRQLGMNTIDMRGKMQQKSFFRAMEEEHKMISRQNMQLLGLTIAKVNYSLKSKKSSGCELADNAGGDVVNVDYIDNMPSEGFLDGNQLFVCANKQRSKGNRRPSSIRVRQKSLSQTGVKRIKQPVNSEYVNYIYEARILSYRQLLFKMQWSYGLYMEMNNIDEDGTNIFKSDKRYRAWIGSGNNGMLIKELLKRRFWWQIVDEKNIDLNFVWTQLKIAQIYQAQSPAVKWVKSDKKDTEMTKQAIHESNKDIPQKRGRIKKQEKDKEDDYLYKIMGVDERTDYISAMRYLKNKQIPERQQNLQLQQFTSEQERVHNHFINNFHLGNKKAMFYNLRQYYELSGKQLFKTIPLTFHIKKGIQDPQYKRFLAYHKKRQTVMRRQEREQENGGKINRPMRNIWIVKPGQLTNRGNGITVIDEIYELNSILKGEKQHDNGIQKTFIVQLYIDRPFLYRRRKFDIRHYLLISQLHGIFKAYWHAEGYIRTSSYQFDVFNFDREIHLTNDAVQKYTPLYGRYEAANKISYGEFQRYLDKQYPKQNYNFFETILPKMKSIALDSVKSTFLKLSPDHRKHNFEIFGMDFMIDSDFNPWLIQINTNPCLELACPLLSRIIPNMVDQAFRLTLDVIYPPPAHYPNTAKHHVPEASLENLKFELIFDERTDGDELYALYKKVHNNLLDQIGQISQDQVYEDNGTELVLDKLL